MPKDLFEDSFRNYRMATTKEIVDTIKELMVECAENPEKYKMIELEAWNSFLVKKEGK